MKIPFISFIFKYVRNRLTLDRIHHLLTRHHFKRLESVISRKVEFKNPQRISIGKGVLIRPYCWIAAMINDLPIKNAFDPWIEIQDGVSIGRFSQITISNGLVIEKNVMITEGVLISDTIHGYEDVRQPICKQRMFNRGPIRIMEGSWIGNGARVVGSVTIGKNSVVGANSYVDKDVPDFSIVVGVPAKVIKRFNTKSGKWEKCQ